MDVYSHVKTVMAMILSLSMALLLKGSVRFIQHPGRLKPYWIHLAWVFYIFLMLLHFWWWELHLSNIKEWYFTQYLFIVLFIMQFYVLASLLYPDDLNDYPGGYESYFYSRKKWFFLLLSITFLADFVDTLIKGWDYFRNYTIEYPVRNISHFLLCLVAMKVDNKKFHAILVIAFIVYELSYIFRLFMKEI